MTVSFIDSSLFMGMSHRDEAIRIAAKNVMVSRYHKGVTMSLAHVGMCDDIVWHFPREIQDEYYPFMDQLHTEMNIRRICYREADVLRYGAMNTSDLEPFRGLLLARVLNEGGCLYTPDPELALLGRDAGGGIYTLEEFGGAELSFPAPHEEAYRRSLVLRVSHPPGHAHREAGLT